MKVPAETESIVMPEPIGLLVYVAWQCVHMRERLLALRIDEMNRKRRQTPGLLGRPEFFYFEEDKNTMHLFPAPDTAGELKVGFHPPAKEI